MPEETFETPQPTQPVTEPKPTNWPKIILVAVLGFGLLAAAAYAGYWYGTESAKPPASPSGGQPKTQDQVTPTPTPASLFETTPTPTPSVEDETKGWKTFQGSRYALKYPTDWTLEGPYKGLTEFPDEIVFFSLDNYTALSLTLGQPPYGFAGPVEFKTGETLDIRVGDVSYKVTENKYKNEGSPSYAVFWDLNADKHTIQWACCGGELEESPLHFVFGNDYPSHARSSDKPNSEERYRQDLETVRKILSTFKFL